MTVQTPFHLQGRVVIHQGHAIHRPMAGVAAHTLVDVNAVIEINEVGQIVDPGPHQRFIGAETLAHGLEHGSLGPDLRVAVHAGFGRWNSGET